MIATLLLLTALGQVPSSTVTVELAELQRLWHVEDALQTCVNVHERDLDRIYTLTSTRSDTVLDVCLGLGAVLGGAAATAAELRGNGDGAPEILADVVKWTGLAGAAVGAGCALYKVLR